MRTTHMKSPSLMVVAQALSRFAQGSFSPSSGVPLTQTPGPLTGLEATEEVVHAVRQRPELGNVTVGRHPIDHLGQELGEAARGVLFADPRLLGDLRETVTSKDLRHRIGRDLLIGAAGYP